MENPFYSKKKVLVTGGTGLVGRALVDLLLKEGAKVRVVSLGSSFPLPEGVEFLKADLSYWESSLQACQGMDYVFQLACAKGSAGFAKTQAAHFLEGNLLVNLHMLKAAHQSGVQRYLYCSSVAVYPDVEIFREDEVWERPPHPSNNRYASWGKRISELQCEAYGEQYGYQTCITRLANIYGPYDNFDPQTAMVIGALISRVCQGEDPLVVWGDGSQIRDFLYVKDCARGMLMAMEKYYQSDPLNLGSGIPVSIRKVVATILKYTPKTPRVEWDTAKPIGNKIRLMDMTKSRQKLGFRPEFSLEEGVKETVEWYLANQGHAFKRHRVFA